MTEGNGNTLIWRVGNLETNIADEREARRRAVEKLDARIDKDFQKLDDDKADAKDIQILTQAFNDLRDETRKENVSTRTTLKWFIGIYVVGLLGFAGIAIQVVSNG